MAASIDTTLRNDNAPVSLRRVPKVSELPLSSAKRAAIDVTLHTYKKKGEFDQLRKTIYAQFEQSVRQYYNTQLYWCCTDSVKDVKANLLQSLQSFADDEIEKDPVKYLSKDRRLAAPLLEGAITRADMYSKAEDQIGQYISGFLAQAEVALRALRQAEVGEALTEEERIRGSKTDEAYAAEAETRRQERTAAHAERLATLKKKETDEKMRKDAEGKAKAEREREQRIQQEKERQVAQQRRAGEDAIVTKQKTAQPELSKQGDHRQDDPSEKQRRDLEALETKRLKDEALRLLLNEDDMADEGHSSRKSNAAGSRNIRSSHGPPYHGEDRRRTRSPARYNDRDQAHSIHNARQDERAPRERDRSRERHARSRSARRNYQRERSRSPQRPATRTEPLVRRRSRSRSPAGIDRYVPNTTDRHDARHRDRERSPHRESERGPARARERSPARRHDREADRDRRVDDRYERHGERDKTRDHARERDKERDRDREYDRRRSSHAFHSSARDRDHERARDRARDTAQDRRRDSQSRDEVRPDIDRYMPSSSSRVHERRPDHDRRSTSRSQR